MLEKAISEYKKKDKLGPMKEHVLNEIHSSLEESRKLIIQADKVCLHYVIELRIRQFMFVRYSYIWPMIDTLKEVFRFMSIPFVLADKN